ncbi:MAG: MASE1 domain-containing protein [Candidatus Riflebacteria bacterium]|nr:MASE1 domain-containing protein [Candidatus Riflebacteria bacterium]
MKMGSPDKSSGAIYFSYPPLLHAALFAGFYFACAFLANDLSFRPGPFINFWLPSGLYVGMLLIHDSRQWPILILGAFAGNIGIDYFNGKPLPVSLIFCFGNSLEALTGAWLVRRYIGKPPMLSKIRDVFALIIFSTLLSTTLSATIGAITVTALYGNSSFWKTWLMWWSGDGMGILLMAPPILALFQLRNILFHRLSFAKCIEGSAVMALLLIGTMFVFDNNWHGNFIFHYMVIPLVIVISLQYGPIGAAVAGLTVAIIGTWIMIYGNSDFFPAGFSEPEKIASWQMFLAFVTSLGLFVAALFSERKMAEQGLMIRKQQLEELNLSLEQRIGDAVSEIRTKDNILIAQNRRAAMGEMINNIAHQWRQPLNTLGLVLANIRETSRAEKPDIQYIEKSVATGNRLVQQMSTTISDFSNFFRPEKDTIPFSAERQIFTAISMIKLSLDEERIAVNVNIPNDMRLLGYPNEYSQVLLNLLSNAKDAIKTSQNFDSGKIEICAMERADHGCVMVRDNGGGISPDILDKIFNPYFSTKPSGNGIGLYLSQMIIEGNMKGSLKAQNFEDGAEFAVSIPLARN